MNQAKIKVLFLCTGNSARSQMAEAFLRHHAGDLYEAHSAGLNPKGLNPYMVQVMDEIGISVAGQSSKSVDAYLGWVNFGWLITVCSHAEENCPRTFLGVSNRIHWNDLEDPAAFVGSVDDTLQLFRNVRDQINGHVRAWLVEQGVVVA